MYKFVLGGLFVGPEPLAGVGAIGSASSAVMGVLHHVMQGITRIFCLFVCFLTNIRDKRKGRKRCLAGLLHVTSASARAQKESGSLQLGWDLLSSLPIF